MKAEYDFSKAKRGAVVPVPRGKTRITIRIDDDILEWFRAQVHRSRGGSYQALINTALREYLARRQLEETVRKVLREEMPKQLLAATRNLKIRPKRSASPTRRASRTTISR